MNWKIIFKKSVKKDIKRIPRSDYQQIKEFLQSITDNPRKTGKLLKGSWAGFWRYRVGNYRIIVHIQNEEFIILVVRIANRSKAYD